MDGWMDGWKAEGEGPVLGPPLGLGGYGLSRLLAYYVPGKVEYVW